MTNSLISVDALHIRSLPGVGSPILGTLPTGTHLETLGGISIDTQYVWIEVKALQWQGWVACGLRGTLVANAPIIVPPAPPPVVVPPVPPKKTRSTNFSFHLSPHFPVDAVKKLLRDTYKAGKPLKWIVSTAGAINPNDIWAESPDTLVLERPYDGVEFQVWRQGAGRPYSWNDPDLYQTGVECVDWIIAKYYGGQVPDFLKDPRCYLQINNEQEIGFGTVSFWNGALDRAARLGIRLAVLNATLGTPKLPGDKPPLNDFWISPETVALLRRLNNLQHGVLMLHSGVDPKKPGKQSWVEEWTFLRHREVKKLLPADLQNIVVLSGEAGQRLSQSTYNADEWIANIRAVDAATSDGEIIFCLWLLGWTSDDWKVDDLDVFLDAFYQYAMSY